MLQRISGDAAIYDPTGAVVAMLPINGDLNTANNTMSVNPYMFQGANQMKRSHLVGAICTVVFNFISMPSHAALISVLGGQAAYDSDRNISWLADANLAASNTFEVSGINANGTMTWDKANEWIAAMNADGGTGYLGFNNWRLSMTPQVDATCSQTDTSGTTPFSFAWNCTGSEMGHLYYDELGGDIIVGISSSGDPDLLELFINIQSTYWSNEALHVSSAAWTFAMNGDGLGGFTAPYITTDANNQFYVWAVRDGGVVPVPAAVWLFGSGLLGLIGIATRKKSA